MTDDLELQRTAALLNHVFEHSEPLTAESLRWYYDENPAGSAAVGRVEENGKRLGNYATNCGGYPTGSDQRLERNGSWDSVSIWRSTLMPEDRVRFVARLKTPMSAGLHKASMASLVLRMRIPLHGWWRHWGGVPLLRFQSR
jgi:hypothetical protein